MKATFTVKPEVFSVEMSLINVEHGQKLNPRFKGLDNDHLQALLCDTPDTYPPIWIASLDLGTSYIVIDGYHRVLSASTQESTRINAQLVTYTLSDYDKEHPDDLPSALYLAAYEGNIKNGKPLTIEERKAYALCLYLEDGDLSWQELARRAKVSDKTVKAYITKALKKTHEAEDETSTEEEKTYYRTQQSYTKKLVTALTKFYDNETVMIGSASGARSENKRAKALVNEVDPDTSIAVMYDSLARSLTQAATIIREKIAQAS